MRGAGRRSEASSGLGGVRIGLDYSASAEGETTRSGHFSS